MTEVHIEIPEIRDAEDIPDLLRYIAGLIDQGCTEGYHPRWLLIGAPVDAEAWLDTYIDAGLNVISPDSKQNFAVVIGDGPDSIRGPFNREQARNIARRHASTQRVYIVADYSTNGVALQDADLTTIYRSRPPRLAEHTLTDEAPLPVDSTDSEYDHRV